MPHSMLMATPSGFDSLMAIRTLLGAAESVVTPGFALLTARFYTRQEQPLRFAIWYSCNGLGSCIGGLLGRLHNTPLLNRPLFADQVSWASQGTESDTLTFQIFRMRIGYSS
jgi:MFS family permease